MVLKGSGETLRNAASSRMKRKKLEGMATSKSVFLKMRIVKKCHKINKEAVSWEGSECQGTMGHHSDVTEYRGVFHAFKGDTVVSGSTALLAEGSLVSTLDHARFQLYCSFVKLGFLQ